MERKMPHDGGPVVDGSFTGYPLRIRALQSLLVDKGVLTAEEIEREVEVLRSRTPATGARLVARAWTDDAFRRRLVADFDAAADELGIDTTGHVEFGVLENTPDVHNVVVCTLCSCYPRAILGIPPDWYKSTAYRSRVVREPRAVLAEFGTVLSERVQVRVHDSTADYRYLVVPERPVSTEHLGEDDLAALVTRDCMIGVALPHYEPAGSG